MLEQDRVERQVGAGWGEEDVDLFGGVRFEQRSEAVGLLADQPLVGG